MLDINKVVDTPLICLHLTVFIKLTIFRHSTHSLLSNYFQCIVFHSGIICWWKECCLPRSLTKKIPAETLLQEWWCDEECFVKWLFSISTNGKRSNRERSEPKIVLIRLKFTENCLHDSKLRFITSRWSEIYRNFLSWLYFLNNLPTSPF